MELKLTSGNDQIMRTSQRFHFTSFFARDFGHKLAIKDNKFGTRDSKIDFLKLLNNISVHIITTLLYKVLFDVLSG